MNYFLYKEPLRVQREFYYPQGCTHLFRELKRLSETLGRGSLATQFLNKFDINDGRCYISVPFDCPEDLVVDDLTHGRFFVETLMGENDPRYNDELDTAESSNIAIRTLLLAGGYVLVTELGRDPGKTRSMLPAKDSIYEINEILYRVVDDRNTDDDIYTALNEPFASIRYLARTENYPSTVDNQFLATVSTNLSSVFMYIFDYSGYLIWRPFCKSQNSGGWAD